MVMRPGSIFYGKHQYSTDLYRNDAIIRSNELKSQLTNCHELVYKLLLGIYIDIIYTETANTIFNITRSMTDI